MDKSKELIDEWKKLNKEASRLLDEHVSFKVYNNIRLKMDKIEEILLEGYEIDVFNL